MNKKHTILTFFATLSLALLFNINVLFGSTPTNGTEQTEYTYTTSETINLGGDVSLTEAENKNHWNPHSVGLTNASQWKTTFKNETHITLTTTATETGHVATGAWWTTSFKQNSKIPLYTSKPIKLIANFSINIININHEPNEEWLRIALACAIQRNDGSVAYTELDFWNSPNTLKHPSGNIAQRGDIIYQGGDVVEYKIDQADTGKWLNYSLDITSFINRAWTLRPGDMLESVYLVIETMGTTATVSIKIDNLWLTRFE